MQGPAHGEPTGVLEGSGDGADEPGAAGALARRKAVGIARGGRRGAIASASPASRTRAAQRTTSSCSTNCASAASSQCACTRRSRVDATTHRGRSARRDWTRAHALRRRSAAQDRRREADRRRRGRDHGPRRCSSHTPTATSEANCAIAPGELDSRSVTELDRPRLAGDDARDRRRRGARRRSNAYAAAQAVNPAPADGRRHRVEHVETSTPADLPRFAKLGVVASCSPSTACRPSPTDPWAVNLGPERAARGWMSGSPGEGRRAVWRSVRDWPVVTLDPLRGIFVAVNRTNFDGEPARRLDARGTAVARARRFARSPAGRPGRRSTSSARAPSSATCSPTS